MRQDDDAFIGRGHRGDGRLMGVTAGMLEELATSARNTPISEMALAGTAIGAAM
jgi:pyruvate/2-oxoglutarate/acetoin dehydrogenase E1 component